MNPEIPRGVFAWYEGDEPPPGAGRPCIKVPCPSFGGEAERDPLEDPDWWTEVTEGWKKHPFLRGVEDGPQGS